MAAIVKAFHILLHLLHRLEVAMRFRDSLKHGEAGDHELSFGTQLVDLLHLIFDLVESRLCLRNGSKTR